MPVVHCPFCDLTYQAPDAAAGKQVACRQCFRKLDVPRNESPSESGPKLKAEEKTAPRRTEPPATPKPKPAATPAKAVARPAPKPRSSPPAQSDRWSFDLDEFNSETVESEELEAMRPAVKKERPRRVRRPRSPRKRTAPYGVFAPFDGLTQPALVANALVAIVLIPLCATNAVLGMLALFIVMLAIKLYYFVDACVDGGFLRVLLFYVIPFSVRLLLLPEFKTIAIAILVPLVPYWLYVFCIRFRYVWPIHLLFVIAMIGLGVVDATADSRGSFQRFVENKLPWLVS